MPLDTRIALGVQPLQVQFRDLGADYNQLAQMRSAESQNQLAQMQMSAAQRAAQEEEGAKNFLSGNPDLSTPENQRRLLAFGKTGLAYGKAIADQQKAKGDSDKTAAEILGLNHKNFTAFNSPMRAAAGGAAGITNYVKAMYADPVLGTLAKKFKTEEQALQENLEMFTKDPDQWITAHSNLEGAQMLDALKMNAERAAERGRIASLQPRPAAAGAAVAPVAAAPTSIETIAPDLRISSAVIAEATNNPNSTAARMLSKMKEQPGLYKLDVAPNSYYDLAPDGQVVAKRMPDNQLAAAVAAAPVNAMAGNEATLQAIAAERKKLTDRLDVLDRLPFSKGVEREIKDKEARLKELNAPINLRADGTSIIPGMGSLAAAPSLTETQKEVAVLADPNASKAAKDAATGRIAKLLDIPAKSVDGAIERFEYAVKNSGYKGSFTDFVVLSTPKTTITNTMKTEGAYGTALAGKIADEDAALRVSAKKAPNLADNANRVLSILDKGDVFVGPAATIKLNIARVLNAAGANNDEKIANTETLISSLGRNTLGMVKESGLGTAQGFTDKDLEFLERVAGGSIDYNAQTLRNLTELAHKAAEASAEAWNKRVKEIPASAVGGTNISIEPVVVPARVTKAAAAVRPAGVPAEWTLQVDAAGKKAYVSPDGKSFKEVP